MSKKTTNSYQRTKRYKKKSILHKLQKAIGYKTEKTIFISEIDPVTYDNKVREKSLIKSITEKFVLRKENTKF